MMTSPLAVKATPLYLLKLNCTILEQLRLEEALLRQDERNFCLINQSTSSAIVMGISGKEELLVNRAKMDQLPVPLIRRFSGGGTVFVDQDTCFISWICNAPCSGAACFPDQVHQFVSQIYQSAMPVCSLALKENDYVIGNRKCGGNAQYLSKNRWVHHTSFLWDFDPCNMDYLLMPPKMPDYRNLRSHDDFLCRLKEFFPERANFEASIVHFLQKRFEVKVVNFCDVARLLDGEHRKATRLEVHKKKDC